MKNIKTKDIIYCIWLLFITIIVGQIYNRQTRGLQKLDYSVTNQDTLKENQKTMLSNLDTLKLTKVDSALVRINKNLNIDN